MSDGVAEQTDALDPWGGHELDPPRERLTRMLDELAHETHTSREHLARVVEDLKSGLEELLVAEEELRVQTEELALSQRAIDAERERYGELFDFAPDAYLVTDGHGKILEANVAASALLGVPARYLEGKLIVSFVEESGRSALRSMLQELCAAPAEPQDGYLQLRRRAGEAAGEDAFRAEARAAARASPSGGVVVRWMIRDITRRLQLEDEVRLLHSEVELMASLSHVARLTSEPPSVDALLQGMVDLAAGALPGCELSIAMLAAGHGADILAASGELAPRLDAGEHEAGEGPCLTAMRIGAAVQAPVGEAEQRWPAFGTLARELDVHSVAAFPMTTPSGRTGAINVYAFTPLTPEAEALLPLVVGQVSVALANAELYEGAHTLAVHLQRALESRAVIEQAKGVLIARQGCTDEEAFDILRRASQRMNRKLRDVAAELVAHVQAPDPAKPRPLSPLAIVPGDGGAGSDAPGARPARRGSRNRPERDHATRAGGEAVPPA